MAHVRITCITKSAPDGGYQHITHAGNPAGNWNWPVEQIIQSIDNRSNTFYVEDDQTPHEIAAAGFDLATVKRVSAMVDRNEYKRRQAAPGVRISQRAFGRDRRFPITSRYDELAPGED